MLGWEVFVYRNDTEADANLVARWKTSAFGLKWLDELVSQGKAHDHGGSGYPCIFTAQASVILPVLTSGLPANGSPLTLGEDYVLPPGWNGEILLNGLNVRNCQPNEQLLIYAWDQS